MERKHLETYGDRKNGLLVWVFQVGEDFVVTQCDTVKDVAIEVRRGFATQALASQYARKCVQ